MWIEKTNTGFRAVERYTDPITGKNKRVYVTMEKNTSATRKQADITLHDKIKKRTTPLSSSSVTVGELIDAWVDNQRLSVKPSTARRDEAAGKQIKALLSPQKPLRELSANYIYKLTLNQYKAPTKRNNAIKRVKQIIKWGYKHDYIDDVTWLEKLTMVKDDEKKKRLQEKYLEHDELNLLLSCISVDRWRDLTLFLALTGMRVGEALALDYTDIDMSVRLIHITKTCDLYTDEVQSPKTYSSERDVYIQDELYPLCKELVSRASQNRFINGRIFPNCKYNSYALYIRTCSEKNLSRRISPHAMRHTHVALLAEHGLSLELIARRLGHHDSTVTRDVYFHVTSRLKEKEYDIIKGVKIL